MWLSHPSPGTPTDHSSLLPLVLALVWKRCRSEVVWRSSSHSEWLLQSWWWWTQSGEEYEVLLGIEFHLPFVRSGLGPFHPTSQLFNFLHFGTKLLQQLHHLISTLLLFLLKPPGFCFQPLQLLLSMISLMHHVHHTLS